MTKPSPYAEDADGWRPAWAKSGFTKADFLKAKAHWAAQPRFVMPPTPVMVGHKCSTCGKLTHLPDGQKPAWAQTSKEALNA